LAGQFAAAAARRGQHAALFVFDESRQTLLSRCDQLHADLRLYVEAGDVSVQPIDPVELAPGEFTHAIRFAVDQRGAKIVIMDRANGEVRQAISVMKKRGSRHERTIREFRLDEGRITVGAALRDFRGILTGVPVYEGPPRSGRNEKLQ
jgi:hypothetical protein